MVFLFWNKALGQRDTALVSVSNDSFYLKNNFLEETVVIAKNRNTIEIYNNQSQDLNKLLQEKLPIQIKSYGSWGSISTLSIRGTSDDQSEVIWNGVPINSSTLGSTDLSLIPLEAIDCINFVVDYQSNNLNSGSFGGFLNLSTNQKTFNKVADSNFVIHISSGYGSNNFFKESLGFVFQNEKMNSNSKIFYQFAKNEFCYLDTYKENSPKVKAMHNKFKTVGFVQDFGFNLPKGNIKFAAWVQQKSKEIPALMGSYENSNKNQNDKIIRISNNYNLKLGSNEFQITGAYVQDKLFYTDKINPDDSLYYIDSKIQTKRFFQSAFLTLHPMKGNWSFIFGQLFNFQKANVNSYSYLPKEFWGALSANFDYSKDKIKIQFGIKQEISNSIQRPYFSFSIKAHSKGINPYFIGFSISEKLRQPDLNDKYWNPGGNLNLMPENGQSFDLFISKNYSIGNCDFSFKLNPYFILINNNIVWIPISGYFSPKNITKTNHSGMDLTTGIKNKGPKNIYSEWTLIYSFNHSVIQKNLVDPSNNGHFLPYRPTNVLRLNYFGNWKGLNWGISNQYVASRYTDNSNNDIFKLPSYCLMDIQIGGQFNFKNHLIEGKLSILNATNTQFQTIRSYPQPGTQFLITINYSIHKSIKH